MAVEIREKRRVIRLLLPQNSTCRVEVFIPLFFLVDVDSASQK